MRYLYTICAIILMGYINNANATYDPFEDPLYQKEWIGNVFGMHQLNGKYDAVPEERPTICISNNEEKDNRAVHVGHTNDSDLLGKLKKAGFGNILFFQPSKISGSVYAAWCGSGNGETYRSIVTPDVYYRWSDAPAHHVINQYGEPEKFVHEWCHGGEIVKANMLQPHLYNKNANKESFWECKCKDSSGSASCKWELYKPQARCETIGGYIYTPENGGNLPKEWLQVSPKAYLQCGQSTDTTTYTIASEPDSRETRDDISRASITYENGACPNNAEYVTLIPQTHLNDSAGGQKWRCECESVEEGAGDHEQKCEWRWVAEIPTCTVQNSPYKNLTVDVAGLTTGERYKIFDKYKYDDNQINKFLAGPTNGTPILMNMSDRTDRNGRRYYFGSYKEISDKFCVSKTCKTKHDDHDHQPDENYEKCIEQRPCQIGFDRNTSLVPVGQRGNNYCHEPPRASIPQVTSTNPAYNIIKDNVSRDASGCEYLCTKSGWAVRLLPRSNTCNEGYAVAPNLRECISIDEVRKRFCEKSGGKFDEVNGCNPPDSGSGVGYNTISLEHMGDTYLYIDICGKSDQLYHPRRGCKKKEKILKEERLKEEINQYFDAQNAKGELEKIMRGLQTWNDTSGTESASVADATSTMSATEDISTLAGRLAAIEGQFGLSKWRTAEGKFNTARLASDLTAGVVLGTTGALVTSSVVKKKQVKDGFESLECTVGGQHVGDWGDVFHIDGK